ncbi:MAG: hypothetical protein IPK79_00865 [Vampirovibrionales bacterium]|nr:hypothetical protein [Vampirovibrionales bacterium]
MRRHTPCHNNVGGGKIAPEQHHPGIHQRQRCGANALQRLAVTGEMQCAVSEFSGVANVNHQTISAQIGGGRRHGLVNTPAVVGTVLCAPSRSVRRTVAGSPGV